VPCERQCARIRSWRPGLQGDAGPPRVARRKDTCRDTYMRQVRGPPPPTPRKVMVPPLPPCGWGGWVAGRSWHPPLWVDKAAGQLGPHGPMEVYGLIFCRPDYVADHTIGRGERRPGLGPDEYTPTDKFKLVLLEVGALDPETLCRYSWEPSFTHKLYLMAFN